MWIVLSGPPGTSKAKIAEFLQKEGFHYLDWRVVVDDTKSIFERELQYLLQRIRIQLEVQERATREDILTIRSVWEGRYVYIKAHAERGEIDEREVKILETIYSSFVDILKPPTAFFYVRCVEKITSFNRIFLSGREINQDYFELVLKKYEEFVELLALPVVSVDHADSIDILLEDVEFGIASLKSNRFSSDTIWKRKLFK